LDGLKGGVMYEVLCYATGFIQFPGLYHTTDIPRV
jgi:hypothetical protein